MAVISAGCFEADPRSVRGAIDAMARAVEADDSGALYNVIDERARHAMISIVKDRRRAAELVRQHYPEEEREAALKALGDAAQVADGRALFTQRCGRACRDQLAARLGAPESQHVEGSEVLVRTTTGDTLRLHRGSDTWYGLVWHTEALDRERDRAARELLQIEENAAIYRRRRELEARVEDTTSVGSDNGQPRPGSNE